MLIACPDCATSYQIEPASLGRTGRPVRCNRCRHVWFVANRAALQEVAEAFRADLVAPPLAPEPPPTEASPTTPVAEFAGPDTTEAPSPPASPFTPPAEPPTIAA